MADNADEASELSMMQVDDAVMKARKKAASMPIGEPGTCFYCEQYSPRLVNDACALCRDKRKLP